MPHQDSTTAPRPLALLLVLALAGPALAGDPPLALRQVLKGNRTRTPQPIELASSSFEYYRPFSELPFLLWPAEGESSPVRRERAAVERWLDAVGPALGHGEFDAVFEATDTWLGREVWRYRLERSGVPLWNAAVLVYWEDDALLGLVNDLPGPVVEISRAGADPPPDAVYFPRRLERGRYALDLLRRVERRLPSGATRTTFEGPNSPGSNLTFVQLPPSTGIGADDGTLEEWPLPAGFGTFPDQIDTAASGLIWFSQPLNDQLTSFDPASATFTKHTVSAGSGPDGMIVGSGGAVWSGLIFSGHLGRYDPVLDLHQAFPAPYSGAALAIPTETSLGTIVVTDHSGHVLEWDPGSQQWLKDVLTPTPNPLIIAGVEDDSQIMWFTEFNANQLARFDLATGALTEIPVPGGGGPAFPAYSDGKVFISLWTKSELACYDIAAGSFTIYDYGGGFLEWGGPIFTAPNGDVCLGTRSEGRIVVFRHATQSFVIYETSSTFPGLKDGLTVDAQGTVWFTESGIDRLGSLKYPH